VATPLVYSVAFWRRKTLNFIGFRTLAFCDVTDITKCQSRRQLAARGESSTRVQNGKLFNKQWYQNSFIAKSYLESPSF